MEKYERYYQLAKKYFWPHIGGPLAVLVLLDYVQVIGKGVYLLVVFWMLILFLGFFVGFADAFMVKVRGVSKYKLPALKVFSVIPTIKWGHQLITWALTEEDVCKEV